MDPASLNNCLVSPGDNRQSAGAMSSRACAFSIAALVGDTEEEEDEDELEEEENAPIISPLGKLPAWCVHVKSMHKMSSVTCRVLVLKSHDKKGRP